MFKHLSSIVLLFCIAAGSYAGTTCDNCTESLAPRLWIPDGDPTTDVLPLKSSQAAIRINGPIAQVTVTQHYSNAGKRAINARYVFPGSTHSAVHGLTMKIGTRTIKAKIEEKQQVSMANRIEPFLAINFEPLSQGKITYSALISVDNSPLPA